MALNVSAAFQILQQLNYTANCEVATAWREQFTSSLKNEAVGFTTKNSTNALFIQSAWPADFGFVNISQIGEFYDTISTTKTGDWIGEAFADIDKTCIAPMLSKSVSFTNLNLTASCNASANFYADSLCAVSTVLPGVLQINELDGFEWISLAAPALNSSAGIAMVRAGWPTDTANITDAAMMAWINLLPKDIDYYGNTSQVAAICQICMHQLCELAQFSGNPDIAGIGLAIFYVMETGLVSFAAIVWVVCQFSFSRSAQFGRFATAVKVVQTPFFLSALFFEFSLSLTIIAALPSLSSFYQSIISQHILLLGCLGLISILLMRGLSQKPDPQENLTMGCLLLSLWVAIVVVMYLDVIYSPFHYGDGACLLAREAGTAFHYRPGLWVFMLPVIPTLFTIYFVGYMVPKNFRQIRSIMKLIREYAIHFLPTGFTTNLNTVSTWLTGACIAICVVILWMLTYHILTLRGEMKEAAGPSWSEDVRGFGQILAILGWLPVILQFIVTLGHEYWESWTDNTKSQSEDENTALVRLLPILPPIDKGVFSRMDTFPE